MKTIVLSALLFGPCLAVAQDEPPAPQAPACASPEHRQFDFWVGEWDVTANGQPAGHNRIERVHGDCVVAENWTSATGSFSGRSINMYDAARGQWHQTWSDSSGTLLLLDGGIEDGAMVLSGQRPGAEGSSLTHRITWTPGEDGSVRQHWETSADGETWTTAFDGLYVRAGGKE